VRGAEAEVRFIRFALTGGIMLTGTLIFWLRCSVAAAFALSAVWKLRHRDEFASVIGLITHSASAEIRDVLIWIVPFVELAISTLLLLPFLLGRIGALAACAFTLLASASLFRNDLSAGCGCWSSGAALSRGPLLTRNAVLLALSALSLAGTPATGPAVLMFCVPIGTLFALIVLEMPNVVQYLRNSAEVGS
jgi:Methylamine utilisation protein MauE